MLARPSSLSYHWSVEGNDCNYVLHHVDSLADLMPEHLTPFITFMRALNNVKAACFTTDYLDPNYKEIIEEFEKCVKELHNKFNIGIINKWHILTKHVSQWIDKYQKPLGRYGDHELEGIHHRFKAIREKRFIVKLVLFPFLFRALFFPLFPLFHFFSSP